MKKILLSLLLMTGTCFAQVQPTAPAQGNLNGNLFANGFGGWSVPQGNLSPFSWSSPTFCVVNYGGTTFPAFTTGTAINIYDQITPAHNETVTVTYTFSTDDQCSITTTVPAYQHTQFSLGPATFGLQEAINSNLNTPVPLTVHLTADWFKLGGTLAMVTSQARGNTLIGIVDDTATPSNWYNWNGTNYVLVPIGSGSGGALGTRLGDLVANNSANTAAVDKNIYVADQPATSVNGLTAQQAVTSANTYNGASILVPGVGRVPFTNPGNNRVLDLRDDVPTTARNVTEDGAACDTREVYGILTAGSNVLTIANGALTALDIGKSIIAVGVTSGGVTTQFESVLASITDSLHGVLTSTSPFNQLVYHEINLGHDDTAAIAATMSKVGTGTFVIPAGSGCQTHTQTLRGQSPIGLGPNSYLIQMPGEDLFQAPDPSQVQGINQGFVHLHDLTLLFDSRIDATLPWQKCNDSGCTAQTPLYRPVATLTAIAADPLAPGWMVGATNGVASITSGSAVMCVPTVETPPAVGQTVIFPYQATIYTSTVASTAGSCPSGSAARTLSANLSITSAQAEWFAGSSVQKLSAAITSTSCPTSITLANNINPVAGWESNVPPFGLLQIDGEQFTWFNRSNAGNTSPANTLYNITCGVNGTTRANHSVGATTFPLNQYQPTYPWPVIPTVNSGDTTPAGTASYYPGWNVGNSVFAFPVVSGATAITTGGWSANSVIEDLTFFAWPNEINGESWQSVNKTGLIYSVTPHYATTFRNLYGLYSYFGITIGAPSLENHTYATTQPTGDGTHYEGITLYAANPVVLSVGNQNTLSDFNVYSSEATTAGAGLGADTCFYFTALHDDQTGSYFDVMSLDHFKNLYCEPEGGPHAASMPQWEWDTYNSEIEDQHMGGGGEVYIGGGQQHWFGGNFNNAIQTPAVVFGSQNTASGVTNLGSEPKGNVYSVNTLIDYGYGNDFNGTTSQRFASPTGPYGGLQVGGRQAIPNQTGDTFNTGNLTAPYTSLDSGFITPEEFNTDFAFESQALNVPWTFDDTSPITHSYVGCSVGNNQGSIYCATGQFNQEVMPIGPGQRLVPGKYTLYMSLKDAATASNTTHISIFSNCAGYNLDLPSIPITNVWPSTAAGVYTTQVDFTSLAGSSSCSLGVRFWGAATADTIQVGYFDFAPVAENFHAQNITVTNINGPGGVTGCQQSPVTGISNGYTCPTLGNQTSLTANQGISDTTITVATTTGFSASGCFFVDGEYECYTSIASGTQFAGISRGAYVTTATTHSSGAVLASVSLVLGSTQQMPSTVIAYGSSEAQIFSINNPTPFNYGGAAVFEINSGGNTTWVDTGGAIHQLNISAYNTLQGHLLVGNGYSINQSIDQTGDVLQDNHQNTAYSPIGLGGGHAGSLNVVAPTTLAAPVLQGFPGAGSSTASWVCTGTDFDGNVVPGATATLTSVAATWSYPSGLTVACPITAGINTYQVWRTAGGGSQGLLTTVSGPNARFSDYGGSTSGGTPPTTNTSNPHISVAGTGNPTIGMGTASITFSTAAPSGSCVSGSLWTNSGGSPNTLYVCQASAWVGK